MCNKLNHLQICKILNLYTPVDDYEQRVTSDFIKKVQTKLKERSDSKEQQVILCFRSQILNNLYLSLLKSYISRRC